MKRPWNLSSRGPPNQIKRSPQSLDTYLCTVFCLMSSASTASCTHNRPSLRLYTVVHTQEAKYTERWPCPPFDILLINYFLVGQPSGRQETPVHYSRDHFCRPASVGRHQVGLPAHREAADKSPIPQLLLSPREVLISTPVCILCLFYEYQFLLCFYRVRVGELGSNFVTWPFIHLQ